MGDKSERSFYKIRQFILDKGLEQRPEPDLGQHGIAGLFKAKDKLFVYAPGAQHGTAPVAFLDPEGVEKDHFLYSHAACSAEHTPKRLGPRQGKDENDGKRLRRHALEAYVDFKDRFTESNDLPCADPVIHQSHAEFVPHGSAMHIKHVPQASSGKPHAVHAIYKIVFKEKNEVHWLFLSGATGGAILAYTRNFFTKSFDSL